MKNNKTQQFARYFLKDIKNKSPKDQDERSDFNELHLSSAS